MMLRLLPAFLTTMLPILFMTVAPPASANPLASPELSQEALEQLPPEIREALELQLQQQEALMGLLPEVLSEIQSEESAPDLCAAQLRRPSCASNSWSNCSDYEGLRSSPVAVKEKAPSVKGFKSMEHYWVQSPPLDTAFAKTVSVSLEGEGGEQVSDLIEKSLAKSGLGSATKYGAGRLCGVYPGNIGYCGLDALQSRARLKSESKQPAIDSKKKRCYHASVDATPIEVVDTDGDLQITGSVRTQPHMSSCRNELTIAYSIHATDREGRVVGQWCKTIGNWSQLDDQCAPDTSDEAMIEDAMGRVIRQIVLEITPSFQRSEVLLASKSAALAKVDKVKSPEALFALLDAAKEETAQEPESYAAHFGLGVAHLLMGRYEDAKSNFTRAAELDGGKHGPEAAQWGISTAEKRMAHDEQLKVYGIAVAR